MWNALFALLITAIPAAIAAPSGIYSFRRAAAAGPYVWILGERNDLFVSADDGRTWQTRKLPAAANLQAIALLDSRRGFAAGALGTLLATEDGGETWRRVALPVQENLTAIHFVGELGWLAGWSGTILHSPDGGRTWQPQQSNVQQGIESIYFTDARHGWAVGWVGTIIRTEDGGKTWEKPA
ncbi:MAG: YCF48-related protein, partial [Bryobacteraceae bacterium]|nr:YCF48-related protein [Bryobacteraceae bacterium]